MIVADTDVLIDFLRAREPAAGRVALELRAGLATTAVTAVELMSGARTAAQRAVVAELLDGLTILPLGSSEATRAAAVRLELEARGEAIGMADCLIAGTCLAREAMLLTRNRKHFERVPGLSLARLTLA